MAVRAAVPALCLAAALAAGCAAPQRSAGDRAIGIYRERLAGARPASGEGTPGGGDKAPRPAPESLTADEAVSLARENSARLAALRARLSEATALVAAADSAPNPELRVSQLRLDQIAEGKPEVRAAVRVNLPKLGEIGADVAEARAAEAEARAELSAEEAAVEADVRWLFDEVLLSEAESAAAAAVAAARNGLAARMKARLDASEATALDEALAALSAAEADEAAADWQSRKDAASADLLDRLGLSPGAKVKLAGDPPTAWPPAPLPSEQLLVETALRSRPEIEIAASRIDASDARAFAERGKRWPWFSFIEVGYEAAPNVTAGLGWTLQAGITVPIFDTNRSGVEAADAAQTASKRALEAEVSKVTLEVRSRLRAARSAEGMVTEMRRRVLPASERAKTAADAALAGQNVDVLRALAVEERRVLVELKLLGLVRRYREAVSALRRAVGGRLPGAGAAAGPADSRAPEGP